MSASRAERRVRIALCLAAVPPLAGCFTYQAWQGASRATAGGPHLAGVVRDYPAAGGRALVVAYRPIGSDRAVDLVVPLDRAGNPAGPFVPPAGMTVVRRPPYGFDYYAVGRLPPGQGDALERERYTPAADRGPVRRLVGTADWLPAVGSADGRPVRAADDGPTLCLLLAYRFDAAGRPVAVPVEPASPAATDFRLPAGTRLVVVPVDVDRPAGDQAGDRVVAVAVTPVAVAADVAVVAVWGSIGLTVAAVAAPVLLPIAVFAPHASPPQAPPPPSLTTRPAPVAVPITVERTVVP